MFQVNLFQLLKFDKLLQFACFFYLSLDCSGFDVAIKKLENYVNDSGDESIRNLLKGRNLLVPCIEKHNLECIRENLRNYGLVYTKQLKVQTNGELRKIMSNIITRGKGVQNQIDKLNPKKNVDKNKAVKFICGLLTYDTQNLNKYFATKS